ncbi:hypothetical protein AS593_22550 [Caulobacter vibrioides]|nr:hypothetical protein AS593_22550 [Caulobacter vibrioides]
MKLLLDTHAVIWWLARPEAISRSAFDAIGDKSNAVMVSAASAYEIEIKRHRDATLASIPEALYDAVVATGFTWLASKRPMRRPPRSYRCIIAIRGIASSSNRRRTKRRDW